MDAELVELFLIAVEDGFRQAEVRDAVAQHAADLVHALEHRDVVAELRELHRDRDAGRARADDRDVLPLGRLALQHGLVEVGLGDIVLDRRDLHRRAAAPLDAVALALGLVVADEGADHAQGVVLEQHGTGLIDIALQEEADHLRDIGLDRAAVHLAHRFLALQAAPRFVDNMDSHFVSPVSFCIQDYLLLSLYKPVYKKSRLKVFITD